MRTRLNITLYVHCLPFAIELNTCSKCLTDIYGTFCCSQNYLGSQNQAVPEIIQYHNVKMTHGCRQHIGNLTFR